MEIIEDIHHLPELGPDAIHIWGVHVPDIQERMDGLKSVLSAPEREKAGRFRREADRVASIAARGALRILLGGYTGTAAAELEFAYSENGKPHLKDSPVAFNVSHSGDWVVIAVGRNRAVGVDIEQIRRDPHVRSIAARYYLPAEIEAMERAEDVQAAFYGFWARKEAYVKAVGSTLFSELKRLSVPLEDGAEMDGWFFYDLAAGSRHAAAVVTDQPLENMPCYDFGGLKWQI